MSIGGTLIHRCTIARSTLAVDAQRNNTATYGPHLADVPCRLVQKSQRVADTVLAERPVATTYLLLVGPRVDIQQGDQVADVVHARSGAPIVSGTFRIESVAQRSGRAVLHRSAQLEKLG